MKKAAIIIIQAFLCILIFIIASFLKNEPYRAEYHIDKISENSVRYCFDNVFKTGSYDIILHYRALDDKTTYCFENDPANDIKAVDAWFQSSVRGYFSDHSEEKKLSILLNFDTTDLVLDIDNIGNGFSIDSIVVEKNSQMGRIYALRLLLLFVFLDILYFLIKKYRKIRTDKDVRILTAGLVLLIFVSCIPLLFHGLNDTYDVPTHLLRIEGLKEALLSGQFPARIQPIQTYGYGYASSIFYPELFLYLPALLRICSFTIVGAFKLFVVSANIATVLIAYFSFKGLFKKEWAAFCGAVLYTLSPYRIGDVYYRQSVGEYLAYMAFPLIAYAMYLIIKEKSDKAYLYLAIGFTIVLQSHILSVIYVAVGCILAALIYHKEFFRKNVIIQSVKSILFTVMVNLWYIIPFFYYYREEYNSFYDYIQGRGLSITQLFVVFMYPKINDPYISGIIPYGIGASILMCLFLVPVFYEKGSRYAKPAVWALICGIVTAFMSTRYFPWDRLAHMGGFLQKLIFNIQFPARMCEPMTICLVVASVIGLLWVEEKYGEYGIIRFILVSAVCVLAYVQSAALTDNVIQKNDMFSMTLMDLDTTLVGIADEYYPKGVTHETLAERDSNIRKSGEEIHISQYDKTGSNISFFVENKGDEGYIDLPVAYYSGYASEKIQLIRSDEGVIRCVIPSGFDGKIQIGYIERALFMICDVISLIAFFFGVYCGRKNKK